MASARPESRPPLRSSDTLRPSIWAELQPNIFSAARLNVSMLPRASIVTMPSAAASRMPRSRSRSAGQGRLRGQAELFVELRHLARRDFEGPLDEVPVLIRRFVGAADALEQRSELLRVGTA